MKPKIFIAIHYLELGGAETSLIGLLQALDPERVDVDLFIYSHRGPLMKYIPDWVNLLPEKAAYAHIESTLVDTVKHGHFAIAFARLLAKVKHYIYIRKHPTDGDDTSLLQYVSECVTPVLPAINPDVEYDLAISFVTPHNIVRDKVKAKRKAAWIHTDYSTVSVNAAQELPVWGAFNNIISISPQVTETFVKTFPTLKPKIVEIENILSTEFVRGRAEEFDATHELTMSGGI